MKVFELMKMLGLTMIITDIFEKKNFRLLNYESSRFIM
jgi:hypothetical protein